MSSSTTTVIPTVSITTTTVQTPLVQRAVQNKSVQNQNGAPSAGSVQSEQERSAAITFWVVTIAAAVLLGVNKARRMCKLRAQQQ